MMTAASPSKSSPAAIHFPPPPTLPPPCVVVRPPANVANDGLTCVDVAVVLHDDGHVGVVAGHWSGHRVYKNKDEAFLFIVVNNSKGLFGGGGKKGREIALVSLLLIIFVFVHCY